MVLYLLGQEAAKLGVEGHVGSHGAIALSLCLSVYDSVSLFFLLCSVSLSITLLLGHCLLASVGLCPMTVSLRTRDLSSLLPSTSAFSLLSFSLTLFLSLSLQTGFLISAETQLVFS